MEIRPCRTTVVINAHSRLDESSQDEPGSYYPFTICARGTAISQLPGKTLRSFFPDYCCFLTKAPASTFCKQTNIPTLDASTKHNDSPHSRQLN
jgi:hypothetical protein